MSSKAIRCAQARAVLGMIEKTAWGEGTVVDLAQRAEILELIDRVEAVSDRLIAGEKEMLAHLKEKYAEPAPGHFDDKICLEVILRNVGIREGYRFDPQRDGGRVVEPFAKPPAKQESN